MKYDADQLMRFINRSTDDADVKAARAALRDALNGEKLRVILGLNRGRGKRGVTFANVEDTDPVFVAVYRYFDGQISKGEAEQVVEVEYEKKTGENIDPRTIEKNIEALRPRVEKKLEVKNWLRDFGATK